MLLFFRNCSEPLHQSKHHHFLFRMHLRTYVDSTIKRVQDRGPDHAADSTIKWVRDRGLDHAVEKEKNLLPLINIKNYIKSEPSKSVPISIIAQNREGLKIPMRPIDFIRMYPSIFEEFLPGGSGIQPHVRLTSEVLELDAEEQLTYQGENYRQQAADRLLKLVMLSRVHKIPLSLIDRLKWDLGLPQDYVQSIVPDFPDYFKIVGYRNFASGSEDMRMLELVCWSNELATSVLEKMTVRVKPDIAEGMPITFPMQFSNGFEMDKKFKKWVDEWKKLPYVSPYENASYLSSSSDESDKWTVAILHELLHMFIAKKAEKENILSIGEYLGLRSRFKRALLHHPGIFYLSSKIGTYTVVLKEGYKRGSLIENNPLMNIRNQYLHLMNKVKEGSKSTNKLDGSVCQQKKEQKKESDDEIGKKNDAEFFDSSDEEGEDASNNYNVSTDRNERGRGSHVGFQENATGNRMRSSKRRNSTMERPLRDAEGERSNRNEGGRKNHVDFQGHAAGNRMRSSKGRNSTTERPFRNTERERSNRNEGGRKNHVDFQENAAGNRMRSSKRRNSTMERPLKDANRERSNKRHLTKTEI